MTDDAYLRLQEFLDRFPLGFPRTPSGVEIRILKRLFTEEEARTAVLLTPFPEEPEMIAERAGLEPRGLRKRLESMSRKGLVFRVHRGDKTLYNAAPFMIGLYEYSVNKIEEELAALFKEYYETAYLDEMGASDVPGFKVIPINEHVQADTKLYPFVNLIEEVKAASRISVADCICRKEASLLAYGCDHPMETCLSFGVAADYYIENGIGREVTPDEAIEILREADEAGLVHAGTNTKHLSNICNCCPCCCASMRGITKRGHDKHKYLNALFEAVVDEEKCVGCEDCVERCPVGALGVEETASVNRGQCLGCGLCAGACSSDAIMMRLRDDFEEPFDRVLNLGVAIINGKRKA